NAVNLTFVTFGRMMNDLNGQVIVFFVLVVAAAEVVVGLAIIVAVVRRRPGASADDVKVLRGGSGAWTRRTRSKTCTAAALEGDRSLTTRPRTTGRRAPARLATQEARLGCRRRFACRPPDRLLENDGQSDLARPCSAVARLRDPRLLREEDRRSAG